MTDGIYTQQDISPQCNTTCGHYCQTLKDDLTTMLNNRTIDNSKAMISKGIWGKVCVLQMNHHCVCWWLSTDRCWAICIHSDDKIFVDIHVFSPLDTSAIPNVMKSLSKCCEITKVSKALLPFKLKYMFCRVPPFTLCRLTNDSRKIKRFSPFVRKMLLNLVAKIKFYTLLHIIIWLLMATL